jgi:SAM-dependent methyltransferase
MSHPEQFAFFGAVAESNPLLIERSRIIEIGSYDVNGSVRALFGTCSEYVGVDLDEGPGVDLVAFGHEVDHQDGTYDLSLSGECFEHDPHWVSTFSNMVRMTRPGGLVVFTCASRGRPEHGTTGTGTQESPGTQAVGLDYYRNLEERDFRAALPLDDFFSDYRFWYMPTSFDLYFAGVRKGAGEPRGTLPSDDRVRQIRRIMSVPHRAVRLPLRAAMNVLPDERYQGVILPYWRTLLRVQDWVAAGRFRRTPAVRN